MSFTIESLPFGIISQSKKSTACKSVAIAYKENAICLYYVNMIRVLVPGVDIDMEYILIADTLNPLIQSGPQIWKTIRETIRQMISSDTLPNEALIPISQCTVHMPILIGD